MLKKVNRVLALMLALIMVLGTLPGIAVFAAEPDSGALVGEAVDPVVGDGALDVPQGADSADDPTAGEPDLDVSQGDADLDVPQDEADAEAQADKGIMPIANTSVNFVEFESSNGKAGSDDFKNQSTAHLEGDGVVIDSYTYIRGGTSATTITIPTEYRKGDQTYKVVRIADNAFAGMELTSIDFAENSEITDIGSNAFASNNLTQFSLPASVQTLGVGCFQGNTDLKTFNFDATSSLKSIPVDCFYNCQNLTTITLPDGITSIGARAFYENDALHYIKIPGSVSEIGSQAFSNINRETNCYIDLTEHEPGRIADAPWGNVDGFVQWNNTDKNEAYYDNDSPFIIDSEGLILGLKANIGHDSNGGKIGSETEDGSDFRWYVKQGNAAHKAGGSSSGGEGGSSDDMMSADGYGASVDFTTLGSLDSGKTYTDNGFTYVYNGTNNIGASGYSNKKGLKFNTSAKIYFTPGKDGLCTVEANYKSGSNAASLKITASDGTSIDNIPVSDSTKITTCEFDVKAGVKYTLEKEGDEFTVVTINVKYGMNSEGNQSLFVLDTTNERAKLNKNDIPTDGLTVDKIFNIPTGGQFAQAKANPTKYGGKTYTDSFKLNSKTITFSPEKDGVLTLVFAADYSCYNAKGTGTELKSQQTIGLEDTGTSTTATELLPQDTDAVSGDNAAIVKFEFEGGKTYNIKNATEIGSRAEMELYLAIAEYGASLATPAPEPTETPEPTEDPGSDTPKAPADYSYIHEKSDSDSFAIDDLTNGGWLDIKIPRYVKKNKDGGDGPDNLIEIKGIADGAFATRPAVYAVHKVDFSELEGVMESIPASAFWNAQKLNNVIIPEGVKTIEKFAFRGCYALEGSEIPESAPEYAQATANNDGKKKAIYLPSTVEKVGYWAFRQCQDSLRTVIFGTQAKDGTDYTKDNRHDAPLTNIDTGAFARCYKLQHIFMQGTPQGSLRGTMTYTDGVETDEGQIPAEPFCAYDANIHYKNSKTTYAYNVDATDSKGYKWVFDRVNKDVVNYVSGATKNKTISEITIPEALTYTDPESKSEVKDDPVIGAGQGTDNTAIFSVSSSKSIHGLDQVTKVGTLHIPETIKEINFSAFYQLGLDTIDFQGGEKSQLEDINYRAFGTDGKRDDEEIENLVFPPNIKNIGSLAFQKRKLNQTEQVELKGTDNKTAQAGVLTLPGEIESVAVDAFDGAEGVGKVSVQQYRYNESDGEYNPAVSHYFDAPEDVYKNAPFGFVPTTEMSNAGIKSPQTEYVDTSLPRYSDYVLQPKNPERPNDRPHAKADPGGTNTAVINLQIIMEGKTTNVYKAEYQQNFAVPTATPDPSLPTAVPAPTMPAEAAPGTSGAQKISKSSLPEGFVFAASGDNQYVTGGSSVKYNNQESKDYFKLGSEDSIMFKSSNSGTLTLVFSAADAGNAAQINVNGERYNVSKVTGQSEMYNNAATAIIDIESDTEYTISGSSGTLNLYFIDLKYDAVSTPEPTEEPTPTPTTGAEEPAATPTPTVTPGTVEPTVTPGTGEPSGDGVAAGVHTISDKNVQGFTFNVSGNPKTNEGTVKYSGTESSTCVQIATGDSISFKAIGKGTAILVFNKTKCASSKISINDSTGYTLTEINNDDNNDNAVQYTLNIEAGKEYKITKNDGTADLYFVDITYTSGDSGIDGPSIASAAKYAPASNLKLIPLEYELDPRAGGENIINNEWWSGDAKLSGPKQIQVDLPENWKTDPQSGLGTQNKADVPYQIDLTNIKGNGTATFTVYYRPEGQPYITIDYHDVLVDVFHKQLYDKNESGGTVNGDLPTQDDAQPEGGADGEKNMYVEGYKVKIKNVDQANFFKKEGAQLCAFAGWLVVPNGADDPKITSGLNKIYDVPPQLSDFTSAKALTDAELTDESIADALKGFVGADGVAFIGYQNLTSGEFTFPMGETDRTLYAVWATDNDGDGTPDYSDLRKLNYHMNGGYWTNGETTYGDEADGQIDPYSVFVPKDEPAYDVYQNNVDPVKNEIEDYAGSGKKMKFAFLGWNLNKYLGYIDAEGNYITEEGEKIPLEENSDIVKNMVTTIDTRDNQNIYDLYAVWGEDLQPDPGTLDPGDGVPDCNQVLYVSNEPKGAEGNPVGTAKHIPTDSGNYRSATASSGADKVIVQPENDSIRLPELEGYVFRGWSTSENYSVDAEHPGANYGPVGGVGVDKDDHNPNTDNIYYPAQLKNTNDAAGELITDEKTWFSKPAGLTKLYAVWEPVKFGVRYLPNGFPKFGAEEDTYPRAPIDTKTYEDGKNVTLLAPLCSPDPYNNDTYFFAPGEGGDASGSHSDNEHSLFLGWTAGDDVPNITSYSLYTKHEVKKPGDTVTMQKDPYSNVMNVFAVWTNDYYDAAKDGAERALNADGSATQGQGVTYRDLKPDYMQVIYNSNAGIYRDNVKNMPYDDNVYSSADDSVTVSQVGGNSTGIPTREGYNFLGWSLNDPEPKAGSDGKITLYYPTTKDADEKYTYKTTFAKGDTMDILYAVWEGIPTYGVVYNGNGDTHGTEPVDNQTYATGADITVKGNVGVDDKTGGDENDDLVREGAVFLGWSNTKTDLIEKPDDLNDVTIYSPDGTSTVQMPEKAELPDNGIFTLYAVWAADANGDSKADYDQIIYQAGDAGDAVKFGDNTTLTYLPYAVDATTVDGSSYTIIEDEPQWENSTFLGWKSNIEGDDKIYKTGTGNTSIAKTSFPATGLILTAQWSSTATLEYNFSGGKLSGGDDTSKSFTHNTGEYVTLGTDGGDLEEEPTKEGYVLIGWTDEAKAENTVYGTAENTLDSVTTITGIAMSETNGETTTVYAVWAEDKYKADDGTDVSDSTPDAYQVRYKEHKPAGVESEVTGMPAQDTNKYTIGQNVTIASNHPTLSGYRFLGWSLNAEDYEQGNLIYNPGNIFVKNGRLDVLYAIWVKEDTTYNLTYHANGGTLSSVYAEDVTDKQNKPREGWESVTGDGTVTISGIAPGITRALELEGSGTDAVGKYTNTFTKGDAVFVGWAALDPDSDSDLINKINNNFGTEPIPEGVKITSRVTLINKDVDVYAIWSTNSYKKDDSETVADVYQVKYDANTSGLGLVEGVQPTYIPEDYDHHTIGDPVAVRAVSVDGGANHEPELEGYKFKGWSLNDPSGKGYKDITSELYHSGDRFTKNGRLDTLYAVWEKVIYYKLTYNANNKFSEGDSLSAAQSYDSGKQFETGDTETLEDIKEDPVTVTNPGGAWLGWTDEAHLTNVQNKFVGTEENPFDPSILIKDVTFKDKDITVYAAWGEDKYTTDSDPMSTEGPTNTMAPDTVADVYQVIYDMGNVPSEYQGNITNIPVDDKTYAPGETVTVGRGSDFSEGNGQPTGYPGYHFAGWYPPGVKSDDPEQRLLPGSTFTKHGYVDILVAHWNPDTDDYSIKYDISDFEHDSNAVVGTAPEIESKYSLTDIFTASASTLTKSKAVFVGWSPIEQKANVTELPKDLIGVGESKSLNDYNENIKDKVLTLYAVWAVDSNDNKTADYLEHVVKYNVNTQMSGNDVYNSQPYPPEAAVVLDDFEAAKEHYKDQFKKELTAPSGYVLIGWTRTNIEGKKYDKDNTMDFPLIESGLIMVNADVTVYAVWAQDTYNYKEPGTDGSDSMPDLYQVRYDANDAGDTPKATNVPVCSDQHAPNTEVTVLGVNGAEPTREGYVFAGWSLNDPSGNGKKLDGSLYRVGDTFTKSAKLDVLTAIWTKDYGVLYHNSAEEDKTAQGRSTYPKDAEARFSTLDQIMTEGFNRSGEGLAFVGWTLDKSVGTNGVVTSLDELKKGEESVLSTSFKFSDENVGKYITDDDLTLDVYALWAEDAYGGGSDHDVPQADKTADMYQVKYDANIPADQPGVTAENIPVDSGKYEAGTSVTVISAGGTPHRDMYNGQAYSFAGWSNNKDYEIGGENAEGDFLKNAGETFTKSAGLDTLYAIWTTDSFAYSVEYNYDWDKDKGWTNKAKLKDGQTAPIDDSSYARGQAVTLLGGDSLEKEGAVFIGWTRNSVIGEDQLNANGNVTKEPASNFFKAAAQAQMQPSNTTGSTKMIMYAVWAEDSNKDGVADYTQIIYDPGTAGDDAKGMPVMSTAVTPNSDASLASTRPTWTGHTFGGWKIIKPETAIDSKTYQPGGQIHVPAEGLTVQAVWDDTYSVIYHSNTGDETDTDVVAEDKYHNPGESVTLSEEFRNNDIESKQKGKNLLFIGWTKTEPGGDKGYGYGGAGDKKPIPTLETSVTIEGKANVDVYAVWAVDNYSYKQPGTEGADDYPDMYQVKYDKNCDDEVAHMPVCSDTHMPNTDETVLGDGGFEPTREHYAFDGWSLNDPSGNGKKPDGSLYRIGDVFRKSDKLDVLYAVWHKLSEVTLTYDGNGKTGGDVPDPEIHEQNSVTQLAENTKNLTREKAIFKGWSELRHDPITSKAAEELAVTSVTLGTSNKTVYALWAADSYGSGTNSDPQPDNIEDYYQYRYDANLDSVGGSGTVEGMPNDPSGRYDAGSQITLPESTAAPALSGYTFRGWSLNDPEGNNIIEGTENGTYDEIPNAFVKSDGLDVLYAVWDGEYSLKYDLKYGLDELSEISGTVDDAAIYYHNVSVTLDKTEIKEIDEKTSGLTFVGWSKTKPTKVVDSSSDLNDLEMVESVTFGYKNETVYAVWAVDTNNDREASDKNGDNIPDYYQYRYDANLPAEGTVQGIPSVPLDTKYTAGQNITIPNSAPTFDKYRFVGWSLNDPEGGNIRVGSFTKTDKFDVLYAIWELIPTYKLIYDPNGESYEITGSIPEVDGNPVNTEITLESNDDARIKKQGRTWIGWTLTKHGDISNLDVLNEITDRVTSVTFTSPANITVYALWAVDENGSSSSVTPATPTPDPDVSPDPDATPAPTAAPIAPDGVPDYYQFRYDENKPRLASGSNVENMPARDATKYDAGRPVTLAESKTAPTLDGYTFMGWSLNDPRGKNILSGTENGIYGADITFNKGSGEDVLYAVWSGAYSLHYNSNGGRGTITDDNSYNSGNVVTLSDNKGAEGAPIMTRSGAVWLGWTESAVHDIINGFKAEAAVQDKVTEITFPRSDVTVYALWAKDTLSAPYGTNGGDGIPDYRQVFYNKNFVDTNSSVEAPKDGKERSLNERVVVQSLDKNERTGYTFLGWSTNPSAGEADSLYNSGDWFSMPDNPDGVTLYAIWRANYGVVYNGNGNTDGDAPVSDAIYGPGSEFNLQGQGTLKKSKAVFAGWVDSNSAGKYIGTTITEVPGSEVWAPGHHTAFIGDSDKPETMTLYAVWAADENEDGVPDYSQVFYEAGASGEVVYNMPDPHTGVVGETTSVARQTPARVGYNFAGWTTESLTPNENGQTYGYDRTARQVSQFNMPNHSVVFTAQWTPVDLEIYYEAAGGSIIHDDVPGDNDMVTHTHIYPDTPLVYGETVELYNPANTPKVQMKLDGAVFEGWSLTDTANEDGSAVKYARKEAMPPLITQIDELTQPVVVYAVWAADSFSADPEKPNGDGVPDYTQVRYDGNGSGDTVTDVPTDNGKYTPGDTVDLQTGTPVRDGYEFIGWSLNEPNGTTAVDKSFTKSDGLDVLYAIWSSGEYKIKYHANTNASENAETDIHESEEAYGSNRSVALAESITWADSKTGFAAPKGYAFAGWSATKPDKQTYDDGEKLPELSKYVTFGTSDIDVYAVWAEDKSGTNNGGGEPGTEPDNIPDRYQVRYVGGLTPEQIAAGEKVTGIPVDNKPYSANEDVTVKSDENGVPTTTLKLNGVPYVFSGWKLNDGEVYQPGGTFKKSDGLDVLTAQWTAAENIYSVVYDANGGVKVDPSSDMPNDPLKYALNEQITTAAGDNLKKDGAVFIGWVKKADYDANADYFKSVIDKQPDDETQARIHGAGTLVELVPDGGASVTMTLYAVWAADVDGDGSADYLEHRVVYDANLGDADAAAANVKHIPVDNNPYRVGAYIEVLEADRSVPTRDDGYHFVGWSLNDPNVEEADYGKLYAAGDSFAKNEGTDTLYAIWTTDYTLTYNKNDNGEESNDYLSRLIFSHNETATLAEISTIDSREPGFASREGYAFVGWTLDKNVGTNGVVASLDEINGKTVTAVTYDDETISKYVDPTTGNLTVYALWGEDNIGSTGEIEPSPTDDPSITPDPDATEKPTPDPDATEGPAPTPGKPDGIPDIYQVMYDANLTEAEIAAGVTAANVPNDGGRYELGASVDVLNAPTRAGDTGMTYHFKGWSLNSPAETDGSLYQPGETFTKTGGLDVLYAIWEPDSRVYNVVYNGTTATEGKAPVDPVAYELTDEINASNESELRKSGAAFVGWTANKAVADDLLNENGNVTQAPEGLIKTGDLVPFTLDDPEGMIMTMYAVWAEDSNGDGIADYAQILYEPGVPAGEESTVSGMPHNPSLVTDGVGTVAGAVPTRDGGYSFMGWKIKDDPASKLYQPDEVITDIPPTGLVLVAQWSGAELSLTYHANEGAITYNGDGGEITVDSVEHSAVYGNTWTYGEKVTLDPDGKLTLTKDGAAFAGWSLTQNTTVFLRQEAMPEIITSIDSLTGSVDVYAVWAADSYGGDPDPSVTDPDSIPDYKQVRYDGNGGGEPVENVPVDKGGYVPGDDVEVKSETPVREGHEFLGWSLNYNNGSGTKPDGNLYQAGDFFTKGDGLDVLYAIWDAVEATPAPSPDITPEPDATPTPTDEPIPTEEPTEEPLPTQAPALKLTYDGNGADGGEVPVDNTDYGPGSVAALKDGSVRRTGAVFLGWSLKKTDKLITSAAEQAAAEITDEVVFSDGDITVYAVWAEDVKGDSTAATPPPAATADPSITPDPDATAAPTPTTGPAIYPDGKPDYKQVIYNLNYSTSAIPPIDKETHESGETVTVTSEKPTRSGYNFLGWNRDAKAADAEYTAGDTFLMPGEGITLYAVWKPVSTGGGSSGGGGGGGGGWYPSPTATPTAAPEPTPAPSTGGSGSGTGGNTPQLNHEDHFAYIVGYPEGDVRPENNIARDEVATIFFRMLTDESRRTYWSQTNGYSDVSADLWSNNAVSTMSNAGVLTGYPDGSFMPEAFITRAEFAAIAARFDSGDYDGVDMFSDVSGLWAEEYIRRAAARGWINGYEDGTFRPDQYITRAEAMTLVNNILNRHVTVEGLLEGMITFTDNSDPNAWYYTAVQEATNSHYYERAEGETNETWTEIRQPRDWAQLEKEWSTSRSAGIQDSVYPQ